jgi:hypothetical protein
MRGRPSTVAAFGRILALMRAASWVVGVLFVLGLSLGLSNAQAQGIEGFRALLSPHGTWVATAAHGEVFVPREAHEAGFAPYLSGGRWEERDAGLAFVSIYAWGEVCLHQGRWIETAEAGGWAWVPGREHASAWVEWRRSDIEIAWRPLAPRGAAAHAWFVAPRDALGSPRLASLARVVDDGAVASFESRVVRTLRDASPLEESDPTVTPRVPPGQVVLSGGGRIVVHGPSGDRVLRVEPVVVSRATAEARRAEQAQRDEERRERERLASIERERLAAAQRERDADAAAERATRAGVRAEQAAADAAARSAEVASAPQRFVSIWPYVVCNPAFGPCTGYGRAGYGVGYARSYGYGALARRPEPAAPPPPPVAPPPTPRPAPIVTRARSSAFGPGRR